MKTEALPVMTAGMMPGNSFRTLTFREITNPAQLEKACRFRYREYANCRLAPFLKRNADMIDLDVFDLHSRHFGLFTGDNILIGHERAVLERHEYFNQMAFDIGMKHGIFTIDEHSHENLKKSSIPDFPFLCHPIKDNAITSLYQALRSRNEKFAQGSRLILSEDFRGCRKTLFFLMECCMMLVVNISSKRSNVINDCSREHSLFYERYGFRPFAGANEFNLFGIRGKIMWMEKSLGAMPADLRLKFERMSLEFTQTGYITGNISRRTGSGASYTD